MAADSPGFQTSRQGNIFLASPKPPDGLWKPTSLLHNRYRGPFPSVERPGHLPTKTEAQYMHYLYSPLYAYKASTGKSHFS